MTPLDLLRPRSSRRHPLRSSNPLTPASPPPRQLLGQRNPPSPPASAERTRLLTPRDYHLLHRADTTSTSGDEADRPKLITFPRCFRGFSPRWSTESDAGEEDEFVLVACDVSEAGGEYYANLGRGTGKSGVRDRGRKYLLRDIAEGWVDVRPAREEGVGSQGVDARKYGVEQGIGEGWVDVDEVMTDDIQNGWVDTENCERVQAEERVEEDVKVPRMVCGLLMFAVEMLKKGVVHL